MPVDGIGNTLAAQSTAAANYNRTESAQNTSALNYKRYNAVSDTQELTMTDFYKLMAAEMKYQDPDNPMDTSELMAQMVQSKMITAMAQMTSTSIITYATSMLGKEVTVAEVDAQGRGTGEYTKGTITGVSLAGESPTVFMGDKEYKMSQIMSVGDVKMQEVPDKEDDKTEGNETEGNETENGSTETTGGESV
ncbi:hypothetical protein FMM74_013730 [Lachnospiraceae bacterium MD308]|jgi:flagellar basal-body rod modification protein FlgD|nr:hypothetical protein [Lachnospiraceae bacterium MD308]MCI8581089.1 hypothetical protein [Dorea sp.]